MNKPTLTSAIAFAACLAMTTMATTAEAQRVDNKAVFATACDFRQAVIDFEKRVVKVRGIARGDERKVDLFEEATRRVVLWTKNPRHASKLVSEYREMLPRQATAERAILQKYTAHHELLELWNRVQWYQQIFEQELAFHLENPRHGNRVQRRDKNDLIFRSQMTRLITPPGMMMQPGSLMTQSGTTARPTTDSRSN